MYPPVDPWGSRNDPTEVDPWGSPTEPASPPAMYGRASVPTPKPLWEPTGELPIVPEPPARASRPTPAVSWQRTSRASRRKLFDGWGFTAAGLMLAFCGWGIWAAAGGATLTFPLLNLLVVITVALGVFGILRLLSFVVLEQLMHRARPHARWAHFLTGVYLTVAGVSFFASSRWFVDGTAWVREQLQRL